MKYEEREILGRRSKIETFHDKNLFVRWNSIREDQQK